MAHIVVVYFEWSLLAERSCRNEIAGLFEFPPGFRRFGFSRAKRYSNRVC